MLKSIDEVLNIIFENICVINNYEEVDLYSALNRVCFEDIKARFNVPPFDTSAMDGFAVKSSDFNGQKDLKLKIIGELSAGSNLKLNINSGEAIRIMTGAPIPKGADAILIKELATETTINNEKYVIPNITTIEPKLHIRTLGTDFKKEDIILQKGLLINPIALAILASNGITKIKVFKKINVGIISTGDELIDPFDEKVKAENFEPEFGKIMNSNQSLLYGLILKYGCIPKIISQVQDNPQQIANAISNNINDCNIILTTGGASVGEYDYLPKALEISGFNTHIFRLKIKPGRPLIYGYKKIDNQTKIVIGLPGNPASAFVSFLKIVRPIINKLSGINPPNELIKVTAILNNNVKRDLERIFYARGKISGFSEYNGIFLPTVEVSNKQDSNILTTALNANCLVEILPGDKPILKGEIVFIELI